MLDWEKACEQINATDWNSLLDDDVDKSWSNWHHQFMQIMEDCIPRASIRTRKNLLWLNKDLIRTMRKQNAAFKYAKWSWNYTKYRKLRNQVTAEMKKAKLQFFQSLDPTKPKQFWKAIKALSKGASVILPLIHEGVTANSPLGKANMLNNYFATCFNKSCNPLNVDQQPVITTPFPEELLCNEEEVEELC